MRPRLTSSGGGGPVSPRRPATRNPKVKGFGVRVQGSGFRVQGSGFRVQGSGFRV